MDILGPVCTKAIARFGRTARWGMADTEALKIAAQEIAALEPGQVRNADSALALAVYKAQNDKRILPRLFVGKAGPRSDIPGAGYLLISSYDGYAREAALRKFGAGLTSSFYCALIEWRSNDWVPQVRKAAREAAERCFPATDAEVLAEALVGLIPSRKKWGRTASHQSPLFACLSREDVAAAFARKLAAATSGPGASILSQALLFPAIDSQFELLAREAVQPHLRALAVKALADGKVRWMTGWKSEWVDKSIAKSKKVPVFEEREITVSPDREAIISRALEDKAVAVRTAALQALIDTMPSSALAQQAGERFVNSGYAGISSRADFLLRKAAAD